LFKRNGDKVAIDKKASFCELLRISPLGEDDSISSKLEMWDSEILALEPQVSRGALNNSHGDWYEWILAITAWNLSISKNSNNHLLLLPNISSFDVNKLYKDAIQQIITLLKDKSLSQAGVSFTTSNPDLVYLKSKTPIHRELISLENLNVQQLESIESAYSNFVDLLGIKELIGFLSVKTSFRPDRRLQIAHEGSVVKAIHAHIINKLGLSSSYALKYFALSTKVGDADRNALRTLAAHSIASPDTSLTAAVDDVIEIDNISAAKTFFDSLIS
jgi:hypothetical protein